MGSSSGLRADGDDRLRETQLALSFGSLDIECVCAGKSGAARDDLDFALTRHAGQSTGQLADHPVLETSEPVQINGGQAEADAMLLHGGGLVDHAGRMQQGLRGNAAHVQTDASQHRVPLHQRHPQPQVRRPERRGVTAGTGTNHDQVEIK